MSREYPDDTNETPCRSCKQCRYYMPYVYEFDLEDPDSQLVSDYGECRRYPPVSMEEESKFPVVEEIDWCGEFDI